MKNAVNETRNTVANFLTKPVISGMVIMSLISATVIAGVEVSSKFSTKEVVIDSAHFKCTDTEPFGIEAQCNQFTRILSSKPR